MQYTAIFHGCKNDNFQMNYFDIFLFLLKALIVGTRYNPQSMFKSKNKKNVYPCKPEVYYIKVGCKGVLITRTCYPDDFCLLLRLI